MWINPMGMSLISGPVTMMWINGPTNKKSMRFLMTVASHSLYFYRHNGGTWHSKLKTSKQLLRLFPRCYWCGLPTFGALSTGYESILTIQQTIGKTIASWFLNNQQLAYEPELEVSCRACLLQLVVSTAQADKFAQSFPVCFQYTWTVSITGHRLMA